MKEIKRELLKRLRDDVRKVINESRISGSYPLEAAMIEGGKIALSYVSRRLTDEMEKLDEEK